MPVSRSFRSVPYIAAGDAFISKARDISVQDTRNMYVLATPNSNTPAALISYPGLKPWSTGGSVGDDRGMHRREFKGLGYHVAGGTLYSISGGGQRNSIGAIAGGERVSWADNGQVLLIVAGSKMYQYDGSSLTVVNTVSESGNTFTPTDVDYLNDKFIALSTDGLIYVANVGETNFVNGFYDAESSPDSTLALQVFDQTILNFGTESIEPWQDAGTGKPPLARVDGGIIENTGIANKNAVDITADAVYFLGRDMIPYALRNFLAEKLTGQNPGIAELFRGYDRDTATVSALKWKGQEFIQFRFPLDNKVWVFSPNTGLWFQLDHGVNKELYKGGSTAFLFNKQIVADYETGSLYELDDDTHTNNSDVIVRERTFRPLSGNTLGLGRTALQMKSVQYEVETGVGVNDENPQMIVQYSIDGGRNFSNERWLRLGKAGDYIAIEDNSNRKFNDLVVKIKYTEPTAFTIYNAHIYVREAGRLIARKAGGQADNPYIPPAPITVAAHVWTLDEIPGTYEDTGNAINKYDLASGGDEAQGLSLRADNGGASAEWDNTADDEPLFNLSAPIDYTGDFTIEAIMRPDDILNRGGSDGQTAHRIGSGVDNKASCPFMMGFANFHDQNENATAFFAMVDGVILIDNIPEFNSDVVPNGLVNDSVDTVTGNTYHLLATFNSTTRALEFYVNGTLVDSSTILESDYNNWLDPDSDQGNNYLGNTSRTSRANVLMGPARIDGAVRTPQRGAIDNVLFHAIYMDAQQAALQATVANYT